MLAKPPSVTSSQGRLFRNLANAIQAFRGTSDGYGNVEHAAHNALIAGLAVEAHHVAAISLAANCVVDEGGQLGSCWHGVAGLDAARKDLVGQLGDVALGLQADYACPGD
eukprot:6212633-Pleurochrysis_carterae.AAC.1